MSSYIIVELNVLDVEKLKQYSQLAAPTVALFGGKFISKGTAQSLHGELNFTSKALIEFASEKQAKEWYHSDEYQSLIELRNQAIESQFHLIA